MRHLRSLVLVATLLAGCRAPTSVELHLTTDANCADHPSTSIAVSRSSTAALEPATITSACQPDGTIGSLVILPASSKDETLLIKVVTSFGGPVETTCVAPAYGPTCIVSRRQLAFVPHEELVLPVVQEVDCAGLICGESQTCRRGSCVSAQVDLDHCKNSPDACGVELEPSGGAAGQGGASGQGGLGGAGPQAGSGGAGVAGTGGKAGTGGAGGTAGAGGIAGTGGAGGTAGAGGIAGSGGAAVTGGAAGMGGMAGSGGSGGGAGQGGAGAAGVGGVGGVGMGGVGGTAGAGGAGVPLVPVGVAAGINTSCAVFDDGRVKCWGQNEKGQLGIEALGDRGETPGSMGNNLPFVDLAQAKMTRVVTSDETTCGRAMDGTLRCWGANAAGQLGQGDTNWRGDKPGTMGVALKPIDLGAGALVSQVAVENTTVCALLTLGGKAQIKCWGGGVLGLGNMTPHGATPGTMGDSLPPLDFGANKTPIGLAAGYGHACALLNTDQVKCWGSNQSGQLGQGDIQTRGNQSGQMGDQLLAVDLGLGQKALVVAAGQSNSCAILGSGKIKCWGDNTYGQLGTGDTTNRGDNPNEMGDNLPFIDLGTGLKASAMCAGAEFMCAILSSNQIKCWGRNLEGQLGLGDTNHRGDNPNEMGDNLPAVDTGVSSPPIALDCSFLHTCALFADKQVKCWGINTAGRLGLGDEITRGSKPGQMGQNLPAVDLGTAP